jgi:N-formylglutamate amidohydrolase
VPTNRAKAPLSRRAACALLLGAAALPALRAATPARPDTPAAPNAKTPGTAYFGIARYIEYVAGDLPIVLTSPHGGRLRPATVADRKEGVTDMDANSQELARALAAAFQARTGAHVHLVASHLHRSKLDPNREIKEAAQGEPAAELAWREFHASIAGALAAAVARHGFAFLVDIHGHSHPIARLELGYALSTAQLNVSDADFDRSGVIAASTFRDLHARRAGSAAALLRGPRSLGALFAAQGYDVVPAPATPQPGTHPYFNGGYIVRHHTAAPHAAAVSGLQIECHRVGVRDTEANREKFARTAAEVLLTFLQDHYAYTAPKKITARHPLFR